MKEQNQTKTIDTDEQTIDNADEIYNWLQNPDNNFTTPGGSIDGNDLAHGIIEDILGASTAAIR